MTVVQIKMTKKQAERVLEGIPVELKKLKFDYVNTPTDDEEGCKQIISRMEDLRTLKMGLEDKLGEIYSLENERDIAIMKNLLRRMGLGGCIKDE